MRSVAVAGVHALPPDQYWSLSLGDLILAAATPLLSGQDIDALFCALPSAAPVQNQADGAAIAADRLGLSPKIVQGADAGDASAGAALQLAWQFLGSGAVETALVIGAAKTSDLGEHDRQVLLDRLLDQEADENALSYAAQAGLLAGQYCQARTGNAERLASVTSSNLSAWSGECGRAAPSSAELRRDLVVAPPLVRSDFPQLLDGACAVLLTTKSARDCWTIESVGAGSDTVSLWERRDPLAFVAVEKAVTGAIDGTIPAWVEIDCGVSIAQRLTEDAILRVAKTKPDLVNIRGGSHGRGRVFGSSLLYQFGDIIDSRASFPSVLAVTVAGLGSRAFAARLGKSGT